MKVFLFILSFFIFTFSANAQRVRVTGFLTEKDTDVVKDNVLINIVGTTESFFSDDAGRFVLYINKKDSVKFFVQGYKTFKLYLGDSVLRKEYRPKIRLERLSATTSKSVLIRGAKNLQQIEHDISTMNDLPHELETPNIGISSVISMLYDEFGKNGRNREHLKEQLFENNRRLVFNELYRFYNYNSIMNLPEKNFEDFTNFHHLPTEFLQQNNYYDISVTLKAYYKKYASLKGLNW